MDLPARYRRRRGTASRPSKVGLDHLGVAGKEKIKVTLMLRPSAVMARMAGIPSGVAGI